MTEERTCRCKGQFAMHKPALHADRDGSEARAQLEREHERALAAYVPEDKADEVERLRAEVETWRARYEVADDEAKAAEAALARVEALCDEEDARIAEANTERERRGIVSLKTGQPFRLVGILPTRVVRAAMAEPEAAS